MINAVLERCAGIDIGKKFLVACVMAGPADGEPKLSSAASARLYRSWSA